MLPNGRPTSPNFINQCSNNICKLHGYKLLAVVTISFIFIQYFAGSATYHHHFVQTLPPRVPWAMQDGGNVVGPNLIETAKYSRRPQKLLLLKEENLEHKRESLEQANSSTVSNSELTTGKSSPKETCSVVPPKLVGRLKVLTVAPSWADLKELYSLVEPGGRSRPLDCTARHKVAIIIPYRDRDEHLRALLYNLHPVLLRQQIDYGVYVVEEIPKVKFNRAKLMNIGFVEALKQYDYECFIFHDVDLIPEDDRNLYTCPDQPRHMSVAINNMKYRLPYKDIFGGVSAVTREQMEKVNGFSNEFWGWGGEDDDFSNRIRHHGFRISRYPAEIARYTMLKHKKDTPDPERFKKLYKGKQRYKTDGLSNLKYERKKVEFRPMYTWVYVDLLKT